jgi:hypothetical protein
MACFCKKKSGQGCRLRHHGLEKIGAKTAGTVNIGYGVENGGDARLWLS